MDTAIDSTCNQSGRLVFGLDQQRPAEELIPVGAGFVPARLGTGNGQAQSLPLQNPIDRLTTANNARARIDREIQSLRLKLHITDGTDTEAIRTITAAMIAKIKQGDEYAEDASAALAEIMAAPRSN